jgi:glutamine synthetase
VASDPEFKPSVAEVMSWFEEDKVAFASMQFTDIMGMVKNVTIPTKEVEEALTAGIWFDGSSIDGFARIAESDMFLMPDRSTYAVMPWKSEERRTARLICDVYNPNGDPFPGDPRHVLRRQIDRLAKMGYGYNTGPELEFFLFSADNQQISVEPYDRAGYFDLSTDIASVVREDMVIALGQMGITVEQAHHEVAIGQHEIDFRYGDALKTADHAVTFKYTLKAIAQRYGLHATFMPKPVEGINGSGMHVHQSFFSLEDGSNAFVDQSDPYGLSKIARQFIAGQLHHARGMCAVFAPIINSYQRLVPGYEAPVYVGWARTNRSALIRVPSIRPQRPQSTRVELRCPDPSCNPYLALAVMLAAGIDGIENDIPLADPVEEDLYHMSADERASKDIASLPGTLGEAIEAMQADGIVEEALGSHIYNHLVDAQTQEWAAYRMHVSPWIRERYMATY